MEAEIFVRQFIAHYMQYRAAILQKDGYRIRQQYGFMNNMKHVLISRFGKSDEEIQKLISDVEETIKYGRP